MTVVDEPTAAAAGGVVPFPPIDPARNQIVLCVGRKGSGKSVQARELFRGWPGVDRLVIDPTGDADPGADVEQIIIREPQLQMPRDKNGGHVVVRYIANPASKTYLDDLDRAVGMALFPKDRRVVAWIDEAGEVFPAGRTGPNGRTFLQQSRHWHASAILCCPRPINIDPLCLAQADRVVMYDVPNPADRERIAGAIGWPPRLLAQQLDETRRMGKHWFLLFDAGSHEMYQCPPLPITG